MKGFDEACRRQVESFTQKGSVGIKVNDDIGHYFQTHKGLRQGDRMSPILFNIVVDMLAILIGREKEARKVGGLVPRLVDGCVSILQYADDTIIFMEHCWKYALEAIIKLLLYFLVHDNCLLFML